MARRAHRNRPLLRTASALALAFALVAAPGCAGRRFDALMRSWEGHSLDELYRTWGPPNVLFADGKGGRVAVYIPVEQPGSRTSAESERRRAAASTRVYDPAMEAEWPIFRIFFVDEKGRIARTGWRGQWECCAN